MIGGLRANIHYARHHLLRAKNEYNKAALLPTTLDDYKEVLNFISLEKPAKNFLRGNRDSWLGSKTG